MGTDKARLPHGEVPAAVFLVGVLEAAGLRASIVRRGAPDGMPWIRANGAAVRVIYEPEEGGRHPLNGVVAAFGDARQAILIVPCDVLRLGVESVRRLVARPAVAKGDRVHPLVSHLPWELRDRAVGLRDRGGPARALVEGLEPLLIPAEELEDRNSGGGPWPVDLLRKRLEFVGDAEFARIARSERARQRARGVVDPSANRYASAPE